MSDNENEKKPGFGEALKEAIRYMGPALAASISSRDPMAPFQAYNQALAQKQQMQQQQMNQQANLQKQLQAEQNMNLKLQNLLMRRREMAVRETDALRRAKSGKSLSDKQIETISAFNESIRQAQLISQLPVNPEQGPIWSRYTNFLQGLGIDAPKDFQKTKAITVNLLSSYVKAISGTAASDKERELLMGVVPTINDTEQQFKTKLEAFKKIAASGRENFLNSIKSGQELRRSTVEAMLASLPKEQVFATEVDEATSLINQFEAWDEGR